MDKNVVQLKISLKGSDPLIWRHVLGPIDITLDDLHGIIQTLKGWENTHLYEFRTKDKRYGISMEDNLIFETEERPPLNNIRSTKLSNILSGPLRPFEYIYDFGDNWVHEIQPEKFLTRDEAGPVPICVEGEYNGPPEDIDGMPGFYYHLQIAENTSHPDYGYFADWPGDYDPEEFDWDEINWQFCFFNHKK